MKLLQGHSSALLVPRPAQPAAHTYEAVNSAINEVVFDGRYRLAPVYLDLEEELVKELASRLGIPAAEFLPLLAQTTASTLNWEQTNPFIWHLGQLLLCSCDDCCAPPPFTALLCTLSLAAERMRQDDKYSCNNYYERLFELFNVTNDQHKQRIRNNAKLTQKFWDYLNNWLIKNDFEYGRPTATQVNKWKYVSYALSQALVREADRKRLHNMFAEFGLSPRERLTEPEITLYLQEWFHGSRAPTWLKKMWETPELRSRVCTAARIELENWDGADTQGDGGRDRRSLNWAASLSTFPRLKLDLVLTTASEKDSAQTLNLKSGASHAATAAFAACDNGLWLSPAPGADFSVIEPRNKIQLNALMLASFELHDLASGRSLKRVARPIIPLIKLDTGPYYREVSRVSLLRPHLLLCHVQWRERITTHLKRHARPGFSELTRSALPGLPESWVLFTGVEILCIGNVHVNNDLQVLVPLSECSVLEISGGLRLAQNIWHAKALPEIMAASERGPLAIELREEQNTGASVLAKSQSEGSICRLSLGNINLDPPNANLTAFAMHGGKELSKRDLSLRTARYPRPVKVFSTAIPVYAISADWPQGFFYSYPKNETPEGALILSGLLADASVSPKPSTFQPGMETLPPSAPENEEDAIPAPTYVIQPVSGLNETCILRGYHYWICDSFNEGDHHRDAKLMVCKDCHNTFLAQERSGLRKNQAKHHGDPTPVDVGVPLDMPTRQQIRPAPDLLFDAVCYLGGGSWRWLLDLLSEDAETPWFASRFAAALTDLGHIDVASSRSPNHPGSWVCAPPVFAVTVDGHGFLAGFRCDTFITAISAALNKTGARPKAVAQKNAPTALLWHGVNFAAAEEQLANITDPYGRFVAVVRAPGDIITVHAPPFSKVLDILPDITIDNPRELERFDPITCRWQRASAFKGSGAYRIVFAGRRYFYRSPSGALKEGSYETVKLLAARDAEVRLHGYRESTSDFLCAAGCEPPGLFRRALITCSGLLPELSDGRLRYRNIPPAMAASILQKLYS